MVPQPLQDGSLDAWNATAGAPLYAAAAAAAAQGGNLTVTPPLPVNQYMLVRASTARVGCRFALTKALRLGRGFLPAPRGARVGVWVGAWVHV
jgi:hypothetical protein